MGLQARLAEKTSWVRVKIASLSDFVFTCISMLCSIVKSKYLWRGRLVMVSFANNVEFSPESGFMTYFHVKPKLSYRMNAVIVQVSLLYRLNILQG